jgi:signal transduction histidine kinase
MTLQTRLNLGILAIAVVLVAPLVISIRSLRDLQTATGSLRDREYAATLLLGRMRSVHDDLAQSTELLTLFPSDTTRRLFLERLATLALQVDTLGQLSGSVNVFRLRSAVARLSGQAPQAYDLSRRGRAAAADSIVDLVMRPALGDVERVLVATEIALEERTSERVQEFAVRTAEASYLALAALGAAILLAFAIALWLSRSISAPIRELDAGMRAVAEGRYGQPLAISENRQDEFGRLAASYRSMASQLQELGRLKAEFVSVASHELLTPVNVMLGYLQLLQENLYGELTPKQREICETLTSQTQLLSRLVRQLLDVSRFEAGGGRLDVRPMVLEDFLRDLERAFRVLALQREVNFDVRVEPDIPHEVYWDSERVNEVLGNLLSNAFRFTSRGGRVSVHVAREGEYVRMQVRDTGTGIPEEQLPHIFEKFYQADSQTPSALRGTGLGLAIAKSIVTAHGGTIGVESKVGVGTRFTIRMPARVMRRVEQAPPSSGEAA